ncbi:2'-5' RNA ligase family protein [Streptomyces hirsutus]|uniref:2'-5' RNA ligase family protein n=1 Tax=Streptomyces hirsutus TaxID=35620 RepID=UPI00340548D2
MHSVELLPDPATERAVRDVWRRLADAGLPSLATHHHPTNRPHLTLVTTDHLPPRTHAHLEHSFAKTLPLPLRLDGPLRFSGRTKVLAWAVRPDEALLHLHETVWRTLRDAPGSGSMNPLLDPARWVPHVTLSRSRGTVRAELPDGLFPRTSDALPGTLTGWWTSARHYDSGLRTTERLGP